MKEKRLLYAIGWVRDEYILEMEQPMAKVRPTRRIWLLAAILAALLLAGCTAVLLRLENLSLGQKIVEEEVVSELSRQGYAGTPNFQAAKEWGEYLDSYDPDRKIWDSLSNAEMIMPDEYYSYSCYTREMTEKVDEICQKYGLEKQGFPQHFSDNWEEICQVLEVSNLLQLSGGVEADYDHGYLFRSGSFAIVGEITVPEGKVPLPFSLRCVSKSDFDEVFLTVQDIPSFRQWSCRNPDGTELLLALGDSEAFVIADKQTYFATAVLGYNQVEFGVVEGWLTREQLEALAQMLDFTYRVQPLSETEWEAVGQQIAQYDAAKHPNMQPGAYLGGTYDERVRFHLENKPNPEQLQYALKDVDGDGSTDLLIGRNGVVHHIYMTDGVDVFERPFNYLAYDLKMTDWGWGGPTNAASYIQICEGNRLLYVFEQKDGSTGYQIAEPVNGVTEWVDYLKKDPDSGAFFQRAHLDDGWKEIAAEEFHQRLDACIPVEIQLLPLSEFPIQ